MNKRVNDYALPLSIRNFGKHNVNLYSGTLFSIMDGMSWDEGRKANLT
jgi:hypothetical protein